MQVELTKAELQMIHDSLHAQCMTLLKSIRRHTTDSYRRRALWAEYKAADKLCNEFFEALTMKVDAA